MQNSPLNPNDRNPHTPAVGNRAGRSLVILAIAVAGISVAAVLGGWWYGLFAAAAATPDRGRVTVLNRLRDRINANYGCDKSGTPRINCGPCARFAIAFREQWNARFGEQINIALVMAPDKSGCGHVVLKFSDGSYFDGGNGVMSEQELVGLFPNCPIEEMLEFDRNRLSELVGGLDHDYPLCPNYSDEFTAKLIESHLARLALEIEEP